jgi:hypothetical protein
VIQSNMLGIPSASAAGVAGLAATGLTATGNSQATALQLATKSHHVVSTTAASTGVILPSASQPSGGLGTGDRITITNLGASALAVYPPVGGQIMALGVNAAFSIPAGKAAEFICTANGAAPTFVAILSA